MIIEKIDKTLSGLKFAVVLLIIFTILMITGTFIESYSGTTFAVRLIYKSPAFIILQLLLFINIAYATISRPLTKKLLGFYITHLGILILFIGSYITYISGIDGQITLNPNDPNRTVFLSEDILLLQDLTNKKEYSFELPSGAFPSNLNQHFQNFFIKKFIPFSENRLVWTDHNNGNHGAEYLVWSNEVNLPLTMTSKDLPDDIVPTGSKIAPYLNFGPMQFYYFSLSFKNCLNRLSDMKSFIIWNQNKNICIDHSSPKISVTKSKLGNMKVILKTIIEGELLFFPNFSKYPMTTTFQLLNNSNYKIFTLKQFTDKPTVLLFGKSLGYYDNKKNSWEFQTFKSENSDLKIPWMNLSITLKEFSPNKSPNLEPYYVIPVKLENNKVRGGGKAVQVSIGDHNFWINNISPTMINYQNHDYSLIISRKNITLPFEIMLDKFVMKTNPGTTMPASYESFISINSSIGTSNHHIYMNNPLKIDDFTFYQSSYFNLNNGGYGSVLSANIDPGRFWKYLGSLLLVLGATLHYYLRRKNLTTT